MTNESINGYNIWHVTALVLLYVAAGLAIFARGESFRAWWKASLRRYAPLYFLGLPALLLYFFLCGFLSILAAVAASMAFPSLMPPGGHGILYVYKAIEWDVSFFGLLVCASIIRWAELPGIWVWWTASIMAIVAGYREARIDSKGQMGPKIADSFDRIDAAIPFLAVIVYLLYLRRTAAKAPRLPLGSSS